MRNSISARGRRPPDRRELQPAYLLTTSSSVRLAVSILIVSTSALGLLQQNEVRAGIVISQSSTFDERCFIAHQSEREDIVVHAVDAFQDACSNGWNA